MRDADVIIVGAGAAGLSLARYLTASAGPGRRVPSVTVVEPPPGPSRSRPRTWCFWEEGEGRNDEFVSASWQHTRIRDADGRPITGTSPYRYKMIRSEHYLPALTEQLTAHDGFQHVSATVTAITDGPHGARVIGVDAQGRTVDLVGRWAFDSRPPRPLPAARTTLFQHFLGHFVETSTDRFDASVADLMDFRTPQPAGGLSFAYVLPFSPRHALVEYTEFSPRPLTKAAYEAALDHYTRRIRPLGPYTVTGTEHGVIPMTDASFARRHGRSVFAIGTAGGATRPATGYTFATIQRQSAAIAEACRSGRRPLPPRAHKRRHLTMDAAWLRALASGRIDGPAFFTRLFADNPLPHVLSFLQGTSTPLQDMRLGLHCPVAAMTHSLAELPLLPRRAAPAHHTGTPSTLPGKSPH
ncbi:lycopene cyclase family protein [Streptomyces montanisoli]|uniref:Lycopene cyclase n=1 Tax=Streptomyces montanisoli TaxID=2798581 RepID=A0A940MAB4_9ACTN|nr:lycopene cyclase family protein [Streptomyces montanisoli]MBP0457654.1 lycopene cyclase [Streptomyces montanisoli]